MEILIKKNDNNRFTVFIESSVNSNHIVTLNDDIHFEMTEGIKSKEELRSFQRFFGQKRDLRNTIINTMGDLATLTAKDDFYNGILKQSDELIANGKVFKQTTENGTELVLKTDNGHTHPPL